MLLPLQWAKEFADFPFYPKNSKAEAEAKAAGKALTLRDVTEGLTMSGSKVETWASEADQIQNVLVGEVLSIVPHPDSDHMVITQIDVGQVKKGEAPIQIVTGAANLKVGDWVPVAMHNSYLPGGVHITKGKLRGVESDGMLCGMGELGLTVHDFPQCIENGIMVFDDEIKAYRNMYLGQPLTEALGLDDTVLDFEITPNRPDCQGVRALGRECAATFKVPFVDHVPEVKPGHGDVNAMLKVDIENPDLCYRYCGAVVENVRVKPSPMWLRQRLRNCGVRPINNLVDITNYVMLEYGQPMHCFDYKYVNGHHITVRNARPGEKIVTLDKEERALQPQMLVIADDKAPIAVAGVMGGEFSGTYEDTTTIVFESAMFNGPSVRTTARDLGLHTEAAGKYSKGLAAANCVPALQRALELVQMLDAGDVVNGIIDNYPCRDESLRTLWADQRRIPLDVAWVNKLLGTALTKEQIVSYLLPLDFKMDGDDVIVPPLRGDMYRNCDIAEEVARYIGYNKMPSTLMKGTAQARPTERQTFDQKILNTLCGYGLYECETFSFYSPKCFDQIELAADDPRRKAVIISNPLGEDTSIMRTTALPSILSVAATNFAARTPEAAVFEQATEYIPSPLEHEVPDNDFNDYPVLVKKLAAEGKTPSDLLPTENQKILCAAYGGDWDYLAMKGVVEKLIATARIAESRLRVVRNESGHTWHPGRTADILCRAGSEEVLLATVGEIHPKVAANYGIKARVVAADISLDGLYRCRAAEATYMPLPKTPATTRDLALVAENAIPSAELVACIRKGAGRILESVSLFDIYTGERIGAGKKSLAYSLVFRAPDRTLTDTEVDAAVQKVLKALGEIGVTIRS
ncbi:MAG: phenylalanine--tRNA ligase subunit beta [Faecalibacterium sp.]|jgi:phenylalanyl-tRNA synthetase beta chain|nr:phenylalanine--tRNA ligase subunit beta [Faecalibacterium sp.]